MFVKYKIPKVGDKVVTTMCHSNDYGFFEVGSKVEIVDITERGYSISDGENTVTDIGWEI